MANEHPLQVARCTKIIGGPQARQQMLQAQQQQQGQQQQQQDGNSLDLPASARPPVLLPQQPQDEDEMAIDYEQAKYLITVKQIAKFVVALGEKVSPTDIEEGMRVGVDRTKYSIQMPLPPPPWTRVSR